MAGPDRSFNDYLEAYKQKATSPQEEAYEAAYAQFALANELMEQRKAFGLTQIALAEASGVGQPEISRIERGLTNATLETLNRVARVLDLRVGLVHDKRTSIAEP